MDMENRAKLNLILSTLAFAISSAGSVLLHIVLATTIYKNTESGVLTSLFLSLQWLPVLAVILYKSDWEDGIDPRRRWIRLDLTAALVTGLAFFFIEGPNYLGLFLVLFARGFVDHMNRVIKTVAARTLFPQHKAPLYASILQTGYHFGIGVAAILGFQFGSKFSLEAVTALDVSTFLAAAALMCFAKSLNSLPDKELKEKAQCEPQKRPSTSLKDRAHCFFTAVTSDPRLFFCALLPFLSSALFQGTYTVFQPIFPIRILHLGAEAVSVSYVIASLSILGGSSLFAYLNRKMNFYEGDFRKTQRMVFALSWTSSISYGVAVATHHLWVAAIAFALMILTFEMVYMFGYAGIVAYAPKGDLGSVFGIIFCLGCTAASLSIVLAGALLDHFNHNFLYVTLIFMSLYLALLYWGQWASRRIQANSGFHTSTLQTVIQKGEGL